MIYSMVRCIFHKKYSTFTRPAITDPLPPLSLHCKDREFPRNVDVVPYNYLFLDVYNIERCSSHS